MKNWWNTGHSGRRQNLLPLRPVQWFHDFQRLKTMQNHLWEKGQPWKIRRPFFPPLLSFLEPILGSPQFGGPPQGKKDKVASKNTKFHFLAIFEKSDFFNISQQQKKRHVWATSKFIRWLLQSKSWFSVFFSDFSGVYKNFSRNDIRTFSVKFLEK